ncbi:MAG: pyridoxal phosphate-dependent aminotransferase [Methylotenera sp.]|nr:pyridoxal phosphate-dependent aminotransferase [Oligoflexia bacterium]
MSVAGSLTFNAFRPVPRTGVIFVTTEAQKLGFGTDPAGTWCNLGQGMPECGYLPEAAPRIESVTLDSLTHEYAPVAGVLELRQAVADMYNRRFRVGKKSQYTAENVAISPGGRPALTRAAAALGNIHVGHFLPDYTAYEELLDIFRMFTPIPIALEVEKNYLISPAELEKEIVGRGLSALLLSNPCNPTGQLIAGQELATWVDLARRLGCVMLMDEFYSHYIWDKKAAARNGMVSAAEYVDDVNTDPVVIIDGLTKNWRYAGWRICWTVAPKSVIEAVSSAGSFLDGGASRPLQCAAIPLLSDQVMDAENKAIQLVFSRKRALLIRRCREMGMIVDVEPQGTFYVFADLSRLPEAISDGMSFFRAALEEKVICVPGEFFDVNPGKRRQNRSSRFNRHVRLSFGPCEKDVTEACDRLETMIRRFQNC